MHKIYRTGATGALLDEYERAINEMIAVITAINPAVLVTLVDSATTDTNCQSIQSILTHVVSAGYRYATYIRRLKGASLPSLGDMPRLSAEEYENDLKAVFLFTLETFNGISDNELETFDDAKKMRASWGQLYDIEQLMEHAIVHILRHRRQIERFKQVLEPA
jgi:uncharacterized damage-inducible protein DinB